MKTTTRLMCTPNYSGEGLCGEWQLSLQHSETSDSSVVKVGKACRRNAMDLASTESQTFGVRVQCLTPVPQSQN
jgi:hypothetical protein